MQEDWKYALRVVNLEEEGEQLLVHRSVRTCRAIPMRDRERKISPIVLIIIINLFYAELDHSQTMPQRHRRAESHKRAEYARGTSGLSS